MLKLSVYALMDFSFGFHRDGIFYISVTGNNFQIKMQGFSYLSEGMARCLLNLGEKAFRPSKLGNLMQFKRTRPPF